MLFVNTDVLHYNVCVYMYVCGYSQSVNEASFQGTGR